MDLKPLQFTWALIHLTLLVNILGFSRVTEPMVCIYIEEEIHFNKLTHTVGTVSPKFAGQASRLETQVEAQLVVLSLKEVYRRNLSSPGDLSYFFKKS